MSGFSLDDLELIVASRVAADSGRSYTRQLLDKGVEHCAKKFGEEAFEVALAAVRGDPAATAGEAADVLYHLLVLLRAAGVPLAEVMAALEGRTAQSGLAEKAARPKD
ncbi:MAG TPA: phosphoribosyl-ATP diphosphatase [Hyphomicrobiales bacterium]|nr:phosphoribosyl-ATP diphosphatase [Hyphomicrobiales bacterium]